MAQAIPLMVAAGGQISSANASRDAANTAAASSDAAVAENRRQFDVATGLTRPSIDAGNTARDQLMRLLGLTNQESTPTATPNVGENPEGGFRGGFRGDFRDSVRGDVIDRFRETPVSPTTESPTETSPLDIIRNTPGFDFRLEQGARAINANRSAGGISGGELIKDFARFNQGVASDFYTDYANRLAAIAGHGQTAATNTAALGVRTGESIGNTLQNAGMARASGIMGRSNTISNGLNDLALYLGEIMNKRDG